MTNDEKSILKSNFGHKGLKQDKYINKATERNLL